ncbi:MAG: hypothetical protein ACI8UO_001384 [Verrucomicrobiales bacterium]|jgi:hypothetical protein
MTIRGDVGKSNPNLNSSAIPLRAIAKFRPQPERSHSNASPFESHTANEKQKKNYGEQFAASDSLESARAAADGLWSVHYQIARVAFKNDRGALTSLGADKRRARKLAEWLTQAKQFYQNARSTPALLAAFAKFGQDQPSLENGQTLVKAVADARDLQKKETGEAQDATEKRDAALEDLDEWMSDFLTIAKLALQDQPQLLEALGVVV